MIEKTYTEEEVRRETFKYFENDALATDVWIKKYALQDNDDNYMELTPDDMHHRLAKEFARIEQKYQNPLSENEIYELFKKFKYIVPQGSPMEGIGNNYRLQSLSNCFVIESPADSYGGIMKTDQELAQLMKRRGGVGFEISTIRPKGARTKNAAKTTDGIGIFMERFSNTTREVAQNGRRGALMLTCLSNYYEIETFLDIKKDLKKVTGANLSIKIDDKLIHAIKNDEMYILQWPVDVENPILKKEISAKKLWNKIIDSAWDTAEPGIIFWDTALKYTPSDIYKDFGFKSVSTNPCISGNSFIETSFGKIYMKDLVEKFKSQEKIQILTYNEKNNNLEYDDLEDAFLTRENTNVIEIEDEEGGKLILTPDHKVYTENRGWVEAAKLLFTDIILKVMETIKKIRIKKINIVKNENVYDLKVKNNHNFFANNILVHNCSEIVLSPYDSCRLIIVNLTGYVFNKFLTTVYFDFDLFSKHVQIAQRLMDDLVDLEIEQIDKILIKVESDPQNDETKLVEKNLWLKIKQSSINGRRTGLGITGLGDTIAYLNIKYGSNESVDMIKKIYKTLAINSEKSSVNLAKERGTFPVFNLELETNHPFLQRIWDEDKELYEEYKKYGRRNIATTTTAPTGSASMMTQTTSGIEPVFMLEYKRRKKIMGDHNIKPDFIDQNGDKWQEFIVYHHGVKKWMEISGNTDIKLSPYWGATANEIDHIKTVEIQAAAQHWLSHSISKTCNLPKSASKELISNLYIQAWEKGCKGFTVYREGSRSGVLVSNETIEFEEHNAPKRPKVLKADYFLCTAKGIKFAVIVGLYKDSNKPYEIFAFENPPILENCKGTITKISKGQYEFNSEYGKIENIHLAADKIEERALTITASMLLRHGVNIKHIDKILKKIDENITSFSSVVRRTLSRYINETTSEQCPECGETLIMQEGCVKCLNCSYSKCS